MLFRSISLIAVPLIIIVGYVSDKIPRQKLLSVLYTSASISLLLMYFVEGTWPIFFSMILFIGTEIASGFNWALVGDMFGRKNFATIRGWISPMYNISLIIGPLLAGYSKDKTGSYEYVLLRSEEHTSELQSLVNLVCRLLLEKKKHT